jgi:bifunctional DNase/RNase
MQEMTVYGVSYDSVGRQPIVLLRTSDGRRVLPIWIGSGEANAILTKLKGSDPPRPMTHDLLQSLVDLVGASVLRVAVTELRDNTYYAMITLRINGEDVEIDSRPSDAIALAVRSGAPIYAAEEVIAESAIEFEHDVEESEDVVEKFKEFLDEVSPEDFAAGDS